MKSKNHNLFKPIVFMTMEFFARPYNGQHHDYFHCDCIKISSNPQRWVHCVLLWHRPHICMKDQKIMSWKQIQKVCQKLDGGQ